MGEDEVNLSDKGFEKKKTDWKEWMISIFFPRRCPICDEAVLYGQKLCDKCKKKVSYIKEPACKKCGKQLENVRQEYCMDCVKKTHHFIQGTQNRLGINNELIVKNSDIKITLTCKQYQFLRCLNGINPDLLFLYHVFHPKYKNQTPLNKNDDKTLYAEFFLIPFLIELPSYKNRLFYNVL